MVTVYISCMSRYLESLNEPTPYDHIQNIPNLHCGSDIVPDLLQFPRSQVETIPCGFLWSWMNLSSVWKNLVPLWGPSLALLVYQYIVWQEQKALVIATIYQGAIASDSASPLDPVVASQPTSQVSSHLFLLHSDLLHHHHHHHRHRHHHHHHHRLRHLVHKELDGKVMEGLTSALLALSTEDSLRCRKIGGQW